MNCPMCPLSGKCRAVRAAAKEHFRWSIHNLIAHPASEIAWLIGMRKLSEWIHNKSIPKHPMEIGTETKEKGKTE